MNDHPGECGQHAHLAAADTLQVAVDLVADCAFMPGRDRVWGQWASPPDRFVRCVRRWVGRLFGRRGHETTSSSSTSSAADGVALDAGDVGDDLVVVRLLGVQLGDHGAEVEHVDVVRHLEHVREVVADDDDADTSVGKAPHKRQHLFGLRDAERGRRLVEDDHLRLLQHGASDRHGLALAAGQRGDLLAHRLHGPDRQPLQRCPGMLLHLRLVEHALVNLFPPQEHVLDDVEVLAQREVLVDDLDAVLGRVLGECRA